MSLRVFLLLFGFAHSFALLSKNLQSFVNKKLMPSDLVKMKAADPNWRGEGIFERITKVAGLFVHKETNEIILETKEKLWTESKIIEKLKSRFRYAPKPAHEYIETRDWNSLFARGYVRTDQFKKYWREALAEIVDIDEYTDGRTVLMTSMRYDDNSVVKILLVRGADVSAKDMNGSTAMHYAATYNRIEAIELLLKFNAKIDGTDDSEQSALMRAVQYDHNSVVKILLEKGADVNAKDSDGWTALHHAEEIETIELLLEFKAEIDATDNSEETPLMRAVKNSQIDAVKVLLGHNARLDMKNSKGQTALEIAKYRRNHYGIQNENIIELLESQQNQVVLENQNKKAGCDKCLIV